MIQASYFDAAASSTVANQTGGDTSGRRWSTQGAVGEKRESKGTGERRAGYVGEGGRVEEAGASGESRRSLDRRSEGESGEGGLEPGGWGLSVALRGRPGVGCLGRKVLSA